MKKRRVVLCIMDGIAYSPHKQGNAFRAAHTPNLDFLHSNFLNCSLVAHGKAVGLPSDSDMGNSEVGHNAIGGGRVVSQGAKLVNEAIENNSLFKGETWRKLIKNVLSHQSCLHFIGLLSDGNVHSHIKHLEAMIREAHKLGIKKIRIHVLLDGRDVGEMSALEYVCPFEEFLSSFKSDYKIASGGGRMLLTMDRYNAEWNMVELGWKTHIKGEGRQFASAEEAIQTYRKEFACTDQYIPPFVIAKKGTAIGKIQDGDSVVFFNFRGDRSIEISRSFDDDKLPYFERGKRPKVFYAGMMQYDGDEKIPKNFLVNPPKILNPIGEYIAQNKLKQFAVSETQKYGHVTFFFNGNRSGKFNSSLEDYVEIPSYPPPFDNHPWMKVSEITNKCIEALNSKQYDFLRLNYPNGDMIGHTGNFNAARISVEAVDYQIGRLMELVKKLRAILLVTADHGNCDELYEMKDGKILYNEKGEIRKKTSHTLNPVPFIIYDPLYQGGYVLNKNKKLSIGNIGSTCLFFLGLDIPNYYLESIALKT